MYVCACACVRVCEGVLAQGLQGALYQFLSAPVLPCALLPLHAAKLCTFCSNGPPGWTALRASRTL